MLLNRCWGRSRLRLFWGRCRRRWFGEYFRALVVLSSPSLVKPVINKIVFINICFGVPESTNSIHWNDEVFNEAGQWINVFAADFGRLERL